MRFGFDKVLRTQKHLLWFILVYFLVLSTECAKVKKGGVRSSLTHPHRNYKPVEVRPEKDIVKGKICIGTNGRMSVPSNRDHHYRNLKDRFTNCTYVDGNLELTWLQDENLDLSFLQYIREVTGYVLISHVDIRRIELPRLQIIRGRTLFKLNVRDEEFALLVTLSKMYTLELPSLRDVLIGSVGLFNNYNLCHVKTIDWKEIMTDSTAPYVYVYNFTSPERSCPRCSNKCEAGCWGEGEENCQKFSKVNCSPQCDQGRCFGSNPRECCHLFCAGGCTGPKQSDCIACRNFYDDGVCTQECPPMQVYDPTTYSWKPNPKGKYAYGATCVKNCPEHLLKDSGACVRSCPANKKAKDGECVSCDGPCPKTCPGDVLIHSGNINKFEECTIIEGYIHILENSFNGFQHVYTNYTFGERYPPMHPDKLEVFKTLKEITGYFNIQAYHKDFKNLSYFRNLEVIGGRTVYEYFATLYIVKTSLESLELNSLKTINSGTVAILENKDLCYAESINWEKIKKNHDHALMLSNNRDNKTCTDKGLVCDKQCTSDGCWGPGPTQCLYCAHFKYDNKCVENCSVLPGLYQASNRVCKICHEECGSTCHGPGAENCTTCKHLRDGNLCVSSCGAYKYAEEGLCKQCHPNCAGGCSGPKNTEGPGGCKFCDKSLINEHSINVCLNINESCPVGYYDDYFIDLPSHSTGQAVCRKCHQRCQECTAFGFHVEVCKKCTNYLKDEQCEDECPHGDFPDENLKKCIPCDPECRSCFGLGPDKCHACRNYRVYEDGVPNNNTFKCVSSCPPQFPYRSFPDNAHAYCSEKSTSLLLTSFSNSNMFVIIGGIIVGIVVVMTIILIFLYCYCRKMKDKEKALNMTLSLSAIEDNEPLRPTNVLPNVAKLRIIKESEIRRGDILGYGAFGTVHKGMWLPEGESNKIPVAIKFLKEDTGANTSKEFLEEAYIMATVDHPNLLQLLAVCMTSQMMLITQLMPLGCLLDFVRNNKAKIGSKHLLDWCTQIARGMAYLEDKRLVHRDLAARNVLVQTPNAVKITDFGLAKLLDINEEQYKAAGGKMPIKWLALECIQRKIFTHKSDVWAFGVTVWELLTFGEKPYDHLSAREVPKFLEDGGRLPHPPIAAIEVFCIMVKCWFPVPETRPCFDELADNFSKMSRDPGRYLTIPGDKYMRTQNYSQIPHDMKNLSSAVKNSWSQLELEAKEHTAPSIKSANGSNQFWPTSSHFSDGSSASQFQNTINQKLLQYSQGIDPTMTSIQSDSSQGTNDSTMFKKNGADEFDAGKAQAHIGTLKLELPVDEDDYLMPSPQQSVTTSTYVDLIDNQVGVKTPDFFKNNIDNPEYLLGNNTPAQTIGLPVSTFATATNPNNPKEGSMFGNTKSIEEESDHEYYNDFDRLQRELQPLHRNNNGSLV